MQYFEASDDKLERIGKVIGDALAALVVLCVIILASGLILFLRARCDATLLLIKRPPGKRLQGQGLNGR